MKRYLLISLAVACFSLAGCDFLSRDADVTRMEQQIDAFQKQVEVLSDGEAKETAKKLLAQMQAGLDEIKASKPSILNVLITAVAIPALAIAPKFIPGLGPIAEVIANLLWAIHATRSQKETEKVTGNTHA